MATLFRLIILSLLAGLLSACSSVYFEPMTPWVQNPSNLGLDYRDVILIHEDGTRLSGWWLPAEGFDAKQAKGTVLYLHGNSQNISTFISLVGWLPAQGYNVFMLDYRGYGLSEGTANLPNAQQDIELALKWLNATQRQPDQPLIVFAQSLGAAMSMDVLAREQQQGEYSCVALEAGFARYRAEAKHIMRQSWLLWPLQPLAQVILPGKKWDPIEHVAGIKTPKLFIHSRQDQVVPFADGQALYKAAVEPKEFLEFNGRHVSAMQYEKNRHKLLEFIQKDCLPSDS